MHITCNKYAPKILLLLSITYPEEQDTQLRMGGGGGLWVTLIFSYTRRLRPFLRVQKFNFSMFWGFQRNEYFCGYEDFVDILGGYHIVGLYLRVIFMHFRVFSFDQGT